MKVLSREIKFGSDFKRRRPKLNNSLEIILMMNIFFLFSLNEANRVQNKNLKLFADELFQERNSSHDRKFLQQNDQSILLNLSYGIKEFK